MIKTYYYAIDKAGQGWYYDNPPIFDGESLPDIANGEMTEIRIKYTAEKCE